MKQKILALLAPWPCCELAAIPIKRLAERERLFFTALMPQATTSIVLAHHVAVEGEWTWYSTADRGEHCDADDHLRAVCTTIHDELIAHEHEAQLVKYPGESGLQFRFVAEAAGLGRIGTNAFLFHLNWGPWVHLRVMATTAALELRPESSGGEFCDACGLCISECPAQAISEDAFSGLQCRSYRKAKGEYDPRGPDGLLPYCERCIRVCPKGDQPVPRGVNKRTVEPGNALGRRLRDGR
jgi:epoxyqueuosine reductase